MKSILEHIKLFEENKATIIHLWISNDNTKIVLRKYNIDNKLFLKDYAFGILDYYIDVVKDQTQIGNCPVITKLLKFLQNKNLKSEELFAICMGLKYALIKFSFTQNIASQELLEQLNYTLDENFKGVLKQFSTSYTDVQNKLHISDDIIDNNVIMSSTDLKGIITYVSQAFSNISGYTKKELIGQPHSIVRHPDMSKEAFKDLWQTIKSGKTWKGEVKNRKKDGGYYWVFATVSPNYDQDGNIISYSAVRQDITSKKEVEKQQNIIIEQSKSTALEEMITMLAHQWRQPLQATAMLIQQLTIEKIIDGQISDETLQKVTDDTQKQLNYMSKTIDEFRDFFKPDKSKENIKISDLIEKARDLIAYTLRVDGIKLNITIKDNITMDLHTNDVVQVILNIVRNARDALMSKKQDHKEINLIAYKENDDFVIKISDNAGGIPEDIISKIFDAYFSTKKGKNGTGLGLYMSRNIIENHERGFLTVSNIENGAEFKIILPINQE